MKDFVDQFKEAEGMCFKKLTYSERIRWRNRALLCLLLFMFIYMIIIGELGLGDSRIMSPLAEDVSRIIFFGGMIWVVWKIIRNKKILGSAGLLKEQLKTEMDERKQYLHDKSGGLVWDIMFVVLLFVTLTTSLVNMPAFYTAYALLSCAVILKLCAYFWYKHR